MKMKPHISATKCFLATTLLILATNTGPVVADEAADIAAIGEVWVQFRTALNSGDIDAMISLWMDDGIQLPPGSLPVIGKENIRAVAEGPLEHYVRDVSLIRDEETQIMGDWAYSWGYYKASLTPRNGGEPHLVDGKYLTIFRRQADGSWKIYRDIFNSNVPPKGN